MLMFNGTVESCLALQLSRGRQSSKQWKVNHSLEHPGDAGLINVRPPLLKMKAESHWVGQQSSWDAFWQIQYLQKKKQKSSCRCSLLPSPFRKHLISAGTPRLSFTDTHKTHFTHCKTKTLRSRLKRKQDEKKTRLQILNGSPWWGTRLQQGGERQRSLIQKTRSAFQSFSPLLKSYVMSGSIFLYLWPHASVNISLQQIDKRALFHFRTVVTSRIFSLFTSVSLRGLVPVCFRWSFSALSAQIYVFQFNVVIRCLYLSYGLLMKKTYIPLEAKLFCCFDKKWWTDKRAPFQAIFWIYEDILEEI